MGDGWESRCPRRPLTYPGRLESRVGGLDLEGFQTMQRAGRVGDECHEVLHQIAFERHWARVVGASNPGDQEPGSWEVDVYGILHDHLADVRDHQLYPGVEEWHVVEGMAAPTKHPGLELQGLVVVGVQHYHRYPPGPIVRQQQPM